MSQAKVEIKESKTKVKKLNKKSKSQHGIAYCHLLDQVYLHFH